MIIAQRLSPSLSLAKCAGLLLLIAALASCDSTEDDPWYLSLASPYTGNVTISTSAGSLTGSMTVNVEQSDKQLTLSGSVQLRGESSTFAALTGAVNETGFFTITGGGYSGALDDPDCGALTGFGESINFFENGSLEIVENYDYAQCGRKSLNARLQRL